MFLQPVSRHDLSIFCSEYLLCLSFPLYHSQHGTSRGLGDDGQDSETHEPSGWDAQLGQETARVQAWR